MSLTDSYLVTTKNLEAFFNALLSAQAPERFTQKFLQDLGFKSTNDRLYIKILKELGFLDESSVPVQRYYDFLDQSQSGAVLAKGIREAYEDLFVINKEAYTLPLEEVINKLRTLTQGKKSDNVIRWMANTFKALSEYADWSDVGIVERPGVSAVAEPQSLDKQPGEVRTTTSPVRPPAPTQLHYNIQIHLPESRDPAVYDAIFQSLKRHLNL